MTVDALNYDCVHEHVFPQSVCTSVYLMNNKVSEFDQEIPQSHTTDQPTAP